jgi:hypothetical protein
LNKEREEYLLCIFLDQHRVSHFFQDKLKTICSEADFEKISNDPMMKDKKRTQEMLDIQANCILKMMD